MMRWRRGAVLVLMFAVSGVALTAELQLGAQGAKMLLTRAGFSVTHTEQLDQDIEFAPWVERMRCSESTVARLKHLLAEAPLRALLKPRETDSGLVFTLQEGIVLGEKPR
mgnify:CR=1 FL=1